MVFLNPPSPRTRGGCVSRLAMVNNTANLSLVVFIILFILDDLVYALGGIDK